MPKSWRSFIFLHCVFVFLFSAASYAKVDSISLNSLLTTDTDKDAMIVSFQQAMSSFDAINKVGIHFLGSSDCQTGWLGYYETPFEPAGFPINNTTVFGLRVDAVFRIGIDSLGWTVLEQTKSILTELTGTNGHFANFLGRCNDQGINCCIPVTCSQESRTCNASENLGIQFFDSYILDFSLF